MSNEKKTYNEMRQKAEAERDRIELRSEKVRNLIGQMPPFLIRWGNTILFVIVLSLAVVGWYLYPLIS